MITAYQCTPFSIGWSIRYHVGMCVALCVYTQIESNYCLVATFTLNWLLLLRRCPVERKSKVHCQQQPRARLFVAWRVCAWRQWRPARREYYSNRGSTYFELLEWLCGYRQLLHEPYISHRHTISAQSERVETCRATCRANVAVSNSFLRVPNCQSVSSDTSTKDCWEQWRKGSVVCLHLCSAVFCRAFAHWIFSVALKF